MHIAVSPKTRGTILAERAVRIAKLRRDYGADAFALAWLGDADRGEIIEVLKSTNGRAFAQKVNRHRS